MKKEQKKVFSSTIRAMCHRKGQKSGIMLFSYEHFLVGADSSASSQYVAESLNGKKAAVGLNLAETQIDFDMS